MTTGVTRGEFLSMSWDEQKQQDLRKVLDPTTTTDLIANCIAPGHKDDSASMVIYRNAVWCFGCRSRWWPDQFLRTIQDLPISTQRGTNRNVEAPRYIPRAVPETYSTWLWESHYKSQQRWLLDRGLSREVCIKNFIGHTGEAYTIPIFDAYRNVLSIRYRRDDQLASSDRPKYWGTQGANQAMLYTPRPLDVPSRYFGTLLCEGELDALRLAQEGYPAVSLTNGCGAMKPEHLNSLPRLGAVSVVYDQDAPGRAAGVEVTALVRSAGRQVRNIRWADTIGKDVTEFIRHQGADRFRGTLDFAWASSS